MNLAIFIVPLILVAIGLLLILIVKRDFDVERETERITEAERVRLARQQLRRDARPNPMMLVALREKTEATNKWRVEAEDNQHQNNQRQNNQHLNN